jgi:hypothetical protein
MPPTVSTASPLLDLLYAERSKVLAVLDAARDPSISELVRGSDLPHASLLEGSEGEMLAKVAPYIVELPRDTALWEKLLPAWGQSWGIFLNTQVGLQAVRDSIRKNLRMRAPSGAEFYFRFYDPRVLRGFLPTCTPEECGEFFGPVSRFVMEADDPAFAAEFRRTAGMAAERRIALKTS